MVGPTVSSLPESPARTANRNERHRHPPEATWLTALREPSAYPDRTQHVELIETHISWVFLTDRYAYKLKKPVSYPFLDFSTLDRRRTYCELEVDLNQRLAPRVYCGVVPVVRTRANKFRIGGSGEVVEWAVKMHRLPATLSLDHLLRHRDLDRLELQRLSRMLIDFYAEVPPVPIATMSYCGRVERHVADNRAELLKPENGLSRSAVLRTHTAQLATLRIFDDLLENRVRDGRIVDGHGDLRPEHIYMLQRPLAIDCLEFSRELREIDVLDELSFLAMECDRLGAAKLGRELLRMYGEAARDPGDERLLAFYKSYRASVRAKVYALRARQLKGREALEALAEARDYLRLAERYAEDLIPPLLILVTGISGSGKSTLAQRLGAELGIEVLQSDELRRQMTPNESGNPPELDAGRYAAAQRDAVYDELLRQAAWRLASGVSVILDATFVRQTWRSQALALATRFRAQAAVVRCECPVGVAQERIEGRKPSSSEAWPGLVPSQAASFESDAAESPVVAVDTLECLPVQSQTVYQHLRERLLNSHH